MATCDEGNMEYPSESSSSFAGGERWSAYCGPCPHVSSSKLDLSNPQFTPSNLLPHVQTIALYRKNAKRSNDPAIQFQLAQYMVQTALINGNFSSSLKSMSSGSSTTNFDLSSPKDSEVDETHVQLSLLKEALSMLKKLAVKGHADSQYLLGDIYSSCALGRPDKERSFKYFLMAAKHGHAEAAYRAALCLQEGWGTARDGTRALNFYKTAAVRNQPGALYQLGIAYFLGGLGLSDTASNRLSGIKWLTRAVNVATVIYNRAPYELAKIYEVGYKDIVIPDESYAVKLYARSAELNFIPAAFKLGRAYEFGDLCCPQDANLSIHYYTIAALGGDPQAQLSLAAWYMVGAGSSFPRDENEAYEWALRAAMNNLPKAQLTVGFFLQNGIGCERDILESSKWLEKAAANGVEAAINLLAEKTPKKASKKKQTCNVM